MTGLARRIKGFVDEGNLDAARALVPMELAYELPQELRTHLRMINQEDHVV